jgi:hypothetical protein
MPWLAKAITRLERAGTIAVAMVATSGALQLSGLPLSVIAAEIVFNLAAARSQAKRCREARLRTG